jgi:transcriptional regulator with XRE-family HTH domain
MSHTELNGLTSEAAALTPEEIDDAAFRARDLAWAVILDEFIRQQEERGLTYKALGDRIRRSKSQIQRWLSSPFSMNIRSLGLLAEGLDVDLVIDVKDRSITDQSRNYMHPMEEAKFYSTTANIFQDSSMNFSSLTEANFFMDEHALGQLYPKTGSLAGHKSDNKSTWSVAGV